MKKLQTDNASGNVITGNPEWPFVESLDVMALPPQTVTIDGVKIVKEIRYPVTNNVRQNVPALIFSPPINGKRGALIDGSTKKRQLFLALGTGDAEAMKGQRIQIFYDPSVRGKAGEIVGGVRFKPAT